MGRPRNIPGQAELGESLDFIDLIERLPPASRPHLLIEEKRRLEKTLKKINKMLEGEPHERHDEEMH